MGSRRRSFIAAASSVVSGVLAGCPGFLGPGGGGNETNATGGGESDAGVDIPTEVASAYPQYQYDAANTGTVPAVTGPTGAVSRLFEFETTGYNPGGTIGSPSIRDGRLYLTAGRLDGDGNAQTAVHAVDPVDGTTRWTTLYAGQNGAGPTAVTDAVVLATVGDRLVGLDPETGVQQWAFDRPVGPGITVSDGTVYVVSAGGDTASLYALSAVDGSLDWTTEVEAETDPVTPAVAGELVYTGGTAVQAFEAATGEERWRVDYGASAPPAVTDERVVVGSGTEIRVFDRSDGTELWSNEVTTYGNRSSPSITNPPAVTDNTIYAVADRGLSAFSLTGSQQRFAREIGVDGTPVVADGYVYLSGPGELVCRSADDGATEWSYGTRQRTDASIAAPAVADDVAYFPAEKLYAIAG